MPAKGIVLFNSSFIGSSVGTAQTWDGGRSAIVINATQYGPNVVVQLQGPSGSWIPINSSFLSDLVFSFDAPPGQYRIVSNAGSSIGVVAKLVSIPYI